MQANRIEVIVLLCMHLLPCLIFYWIAKGVKLKSARREKAFLRKCLPLNLLLNLLVTYILFFVLFSEKNVIGKIVELLSMRCAYADISRLASSVLLHFLLAIPIGYLAVYIVLHELPTHIGGGRMICTMLMILIGVIAAIPGYVLGASGDDQLQLQEVCRKTVGEATADAEDPEEYSYVMIRNDGILRFEADQIYLSDDPKIYDRIPVEQIEIEPGDAYQFRMASAKSLNIHKNGGTTVYLNGRTGRTIDQVSIPALRREDRYVRNGDMWETIKAEIETIVAVPVFSVESGSYDAPFDLTITSEEGTKVYYTLDCSTPSADDTLYTSPIHVYDRSDEPDLYYSIQNVMPDYKNKWKEPSNLPKAFVVRAVAVDADGRSSDVVTTTYFIAQEKAEEYVISLVADPADLFGDEGIYVTGIEYDDWYTDILNDEENNGQIPEDAEAPEANFMKKGKEWEKAADFEVFSDGKLELDQHVGIRIQGNGSRRLQKKRFTIYARKEYDGEGYFARNLINDHLQSAYFTRNGDLHRLAQTLGAGMDFVTTDSAYHHLYLNGEYWYSRYLYEKLNAKNIASKYNLLDDNVTFVKNEVPENDAEEGSIPFSLVFDYLEQNDLSTDEAYKTYGDIIDIQSYIDVTCIQTFLANLDYMEKWNNFFWHTKVAENEAEGDSRWRWALLDMDLNWNSLAEKFQVEQPYQINPFVMYGKWQFTPITEWKIFSALRQNKEFCRQYISTFMDCINTRFAPENTKKILQDLSIADEKTIDFFEKRNPYIVRFTKQEFELNGTLETVTLSSNRSDTPIKLNTITPELTDGSWNGKYFTDYPVTATASGDGFSHWEITSKGNTTISEDQTIEVPVVKGGIEIHAVFE